LLSKKHANHWGTKSQLLRTNTPIAEEPKMDGKDDVRFRMRIVYSLIGLVGGNAVLCLRLLQNAIRVRATLLALGMGAPANQIPLALEMSLINGVCSFVGWLFVGLPIVRFIPAHSIADLSWPLRLLLGALLGPIALLVIFVLLSRGHLSSNSFAGTGLLWLYSIVVSEVSFVLYTALLSRSARNAGAKAATKS
jgi:hypothetical protein